MDKNDNGSDFDRPSSQKGFLRYAVAEKRIFLDALLEFRADKCEYWDRIDNEERERVIEDIPGPLSKLSTLNKERLKVLML